MLSVDPHQGDEPSDEDDLARRAIGSGETESVAPRPAERNAGGDASARGIEGPGAIIGRYKLLQQIGEGGFGAVYMAEQKKPVKRKVALKIIKLGMDTKQVIARFEAERQALAIMDHPNIARVLDAGATDTGRPFFVMELVRGVPLTEYADTECLSTRDRLRLFIDVCRAVQHAHQKGIIHRDLKPSNVMVTLHDGKPVPKVIDFGIAKATSRDLTDKTLFTEYRQLIGTPAYMSPEQAEMSGLDIDTRSDIYSLGVLLYELLTGTTPFDTKRFKGLGLGEIQQMIREEEPHKPSTRLSELTRGKFTPGAKPTDDSASRNTSIQYIAKHRRTDAVNLRRQLTGDLDWIIMKCLEKERSRRYDTANGLATDVERHLNDEPVTAGPPGGTYRLRKAIRRNKGFFTGVAAVFAVLLAAAVVSTAFYLKTEAQRRLVVEKGISATAFLRRAERERDESITATRQAELVTKHLAETLAAVTPDGKGEEVSKAIDTHFRKTPQLEAKIRAAMVATYITLNRLDEAHRHLQALMKMEDLPRSEWDAALGIMRKQGQTLMAQRKHLDAERLTRMAIEIERHVLGEERHNTLFGLATAIVTQGAPGFAEDRFAEADRIMNRGMEIQRRVLGDEHPDTLSMMVAAIRTYYFWNRYDEAEELSRKLLEIQQRTLGKEHIDTLGSITGLALVLAKQHRTVESDKLFSEALEIQRRVFPAGHSDAIQSLDWLIFVHGAAGKVDEMRQLVVNVLAQLRSRADRPSATATEINAYAWRLVTTDPIDLRDPDAALPYARRAVEKSGGKNPSILDTLAVAQAMSGDTRRAAETMTRALGFVPPESITLRVPLQSKLAGYLTKLERFAKAEPLLIAVHEQINTYQPPSPQEVDAAIQRLIDLYDAWNTSEPGQGYAAKVAQYRALLTPVGDARSTQPADP